MLLWKYNCTWMYVKIIKSLFLYLWTCPPIGEYPWLRSLAFAFGDDVFNGLPTLYLKSTHCVYANLLTIIEHIPLSLSPYGHSVAVAMIFGLPWWRLQWTANVTVEIQLHMNIIWIIESLFLYLWTCPPTGEYPWLRSLDFAFGDDVFNGLPTLYLESTHCVYAHLLTTIEHIPLSLSPCGHRVAVALIFGLQWWSLQWTVYNIQCYKKGARSLFTPYIPLIPINHWRLGGTAFVAWL